jgi:DNA-binding response OmpR family regulator
LQYLRVYVTHLRRKLETPASGKLIETQPSVGYRLIAGN